MKIEYPIYDLNLPFSTYIKRSQDIIEEQRLDIQQKNAPRELIIDANSPFDAIPTNPIKANHQVKYGVLLIHGLLDSPFTMKEIAEHLKKIGILSKAILLPGHGVNVNELLNVKHSEWLQAVRYGIHSLQKEVEKIFIIGYSTGATLAVYQALQEPNIAGLVLISPAFKVKGFVKILVGWHNLATLLGTKRDWVFQGEEFDYVRYSSLSFNAFYQLLELIKKIKELSLNRKLTIPMLIIMSREDEITASASAIDYFLKTNNSANKFILYTNQIKNYNDKRITQRLTTKFDKNIKHFSHLTLPISPENDHYGPKGDFPFASRTKLLDMKYGAYNRFVISFFDFLYFANIVKTSRRHLTYNPDFDYMVDEIGKFILNNL